MRDEIRTMLAVASQATDSAGGTATSTPRMTLQLMAEQAIRRAQMARALHMQQSAESARRQAEVRS